MILRRCCRIRTIRQNLVCENGISAALQSGGGDDKQTKCHHYQYLWRSLLDDSAAPYLTVQNHSHRFSRLLTQSAGEGFGMLSGKSWKGFPGLEPPRRFCQMTCWSVYGRREIADEASSYHSLRLRHIYSRRNTILVMFRRRGPETRVGKWVVIRGRL